jgi:hypothetical protein
MRRSSTIRQLANEKELEQLQEKRTIIAKK